MRGGAPTSLGGCERDARSVAPSDGEQSEAGFPPRRGNALGASSVVSMRGMLALRTDAPDQELVKAARRGDTDAFRALYDRHVAGVYALARSILGDAEGAEDVVQTAFIRAWDRLPRLRRGSAFHVWVRQTGRRAAVDELRRRGSHRAASLDEIEEDGGEFASEEEPPESIAASAALSATVRKAVESLPEHHRTVVTLHHLDGLEVREIAEVLGVPVGTVLSRLARARETLQRKLAVVIDDET
jgi:RNA polymerase sigma-70 factor, ECF subfamily